MVVVLAFGALEKGGLMEPLVALSADFDSVAGCSDGGVLLLGLLVVAGDEGVHFHDELLGRDVLVLFFQHFEEGI